MGFCEIRLLQVNVLCCVTYLKLIWLLRYAGGGNILIPLHANGQAFACRAVFSKSRWNLLLSVFSSSRFISFTQSLRFCWFVFFCPIFVLCEVFCFFYYLIFPSCAGWFHESVFLCEICTYIKVGPVFRLSHFWNKCYVIFLLSL